MTIIGANLAGTSTTRDRVKDDFYATPAWATEALLKVERIEGSVWEPACGNGLMAEVIKRHIGAENLTSSDLVNRGYGATGIDFLSSTLPLGSYDHIITNPPFSLFQEFAEKALSIAKYKVCLFGKLQALEGQKRATFLENSPLKRVYVFKHRVNPLRNGSPVDENGKPWSSTMAFAWFVWSPGTRHIAPPEIAWI